MFSSVFSSLVDFFGYIIYQFGRLLSSMPGAAQLIIAVFFISVVVQLILVPIRGGRSFGSGSDKANKKSEKKEGT